METPAIYDKLTDILQDVFDDEDLKARPELTAADVDGWDSLSHIRLMLTVERAFGIKFTAAEIGKLENVGQLVDVIKAKTP